jgi:SLT domain-containing protein
MSHPIRRIQSDIRALQTAKATHQLAASTVRQDQRQLTRDQDAFDTLKKELVALQANPLADPMQLMALTQQTQDARSAVVSDRGAVKGAKHGEAIAAKRVTRDEKRALHDLTPAEYQMGLKQTNATRHALGLKSVRHVVRPELPNVVGGQVGHWIAQAQTVLKQHGVSLSKMNARDINLIIQHESGGNPRAVNNWDSNAAAGHPSEGLMQTIGPTFNSYKLPGHSHILNPVDNIIAGVRYAISRYGSISNVPGVVAVHNGGSYVGY